MFPLIDEPRLQSEPREGVPDVIDTLPAFRDYCDLLAAGTGSLAADAERASGYRYGHEDWLVQFKRTGAGSIRRHWRKRGPTGTISIAP